MVTIVTVVIVVVAAVIAVVFMAISVIPVIAVLIVAISFTSVIAVVAAVAASVITTMSAPVPAPGLAIAMPLVCVGGWAMVPLTMAALFVIAIVVVVVTLVDARLTAKLDGESVLVKKTEVARER